MLRRNDEMKGEMNHRVIYGSEDFVFYFRKNYGIGGMIRPIGRPKERDKIRTLPFFIW